jgi:hypothetical protein
MTSESNRSVAIAMGGCALGGCLVVVLSVAVLIGSGITQYNQMIKKAKRAEAPANLDAIRTAELAYDAIWDTYTAIPLTSSKIPEQLTYVDPSAEPALNALGWTPDGMVRCRYSVTLVDGPGGGRDFDARAECDLDQDGVPCLYRASASQRAWRVTDEDVN